LDPAASAARWPDALANRRAFHRATRQPSWRTQGRLRIHEAGHLTQRGSAARPGEVARWSETKLFDTFGDDRNWFNARRTGCGNGGHYFWPRIKTDANRKALIEYLKTMKAEPRAQNWFLGSRALQ
jgi:hypothetical protein